MAGVGSNLRFQQLHIDVARNSTDDFNPFHDPHRYQRIAGNPYGRPIVLAFQLECLCDFLAERARAEVGGKRPPSKPPIPYRNFQFTFADALLGDEDFSVEIKPAIERSSPPSLSNRVLVKKEGRAVLLGHIRDSIDPLIAADVDPSTLGDLRGVPDRSCLPGTPFFLKRKFLNTANAKNFLAGALVDQSYYFDELDDRVRFPEVFPVALASCALLEKAWSEKHDFMVNPMVYVAHTITVDLAAARALRSNDVLHILASGPRLVARTKGLGGSDLSLQRFRCLGYVRDNRLLYAADIDLTPLDAIYGSARHRSAVDAGVSRREA